MTNATETQAAKCDDCGHRGPANRFPVERHEDGGDWERCPECGSRSVRLDATETRADHTPGPWNYGYHEVIENYIVGPDNGDGIRVVADVGPSRRADARLIAAAPELLEAAETALQWVAGEGGYDTLEPHEIEDILRDAIAKAKGESP